MAAVRTIALGQLTDSPAHFPDSCPAVCTPLLDTLAARLPHHPAVILSVGSGSGLLESLLLRVSDDRLNIYGVEVSASVNRHLPEDRMLEVSGTSALCADAMLSSALIFVYPRQPGLIKSYLKDCSDGALEMLVWFGPRNDWPDYESLLVNAFESIEIIDGPQVAQYELLAILRGPRS